MSGQSPVQISVVISTRNRAGQLRLCLEALTSQRNVAPEAYEIIVVDNGSTDLTEQTVKTIQRGFAQITYLYEEKLGLSIARNAGARHAQGAILCFTDDDAVTCPNYVGEVLSSFVDPATACVGGKVIASWPDGSPPDWFSPKYAHVVAQTSFGETPRRMRNGEFPYGCNISFRKETFEAFGGFDENLGKRGGNNIWGEEIDLCHRIQRQGLQFFYNPRAVVTHTVGRGRATQHYFIESIFGKGVTEGYQKRAHKGPAVFTAYLLLKVARLAMTSVSYLLAASWLSEPSRFRLRCAISWYAGYLYFLAVWNDLGVAPESAEQVPMPTPNTKGSQL
jgi:glycosyltransferase involved in cell wall biosynthesis